MHRYGHPVARIHFDQDSANPSSVTGSPFGQSVLREQKRSASATAAKAAMPTDVRGFSRMNLVVARMAFREAGMRVSSACSRVARATSGNAEKRSWVFIF